VKHENGDDVVDAHFVEVMSIEFFEDSLVVMMDWSTVTPQSYYSCFHERDESKICSE
jgi:hypothetical protein